MTSYHTAHTCRPDPRPRPALPRPARLEGLQRVRRARARVARMNAPRVRNVQRVLAAALVAIHVARASPDTQRQVPPRRRGHVAGAEGSRGARARRARARAAVGPRSAGLARIACPGRPRSHTPYSACACVNSQYSPQPR